MGYIGLPEPDEPRARRKSRRKRLTGRVLTGRILEATVDESREIKNIK